MPQIQLGPPPIGSPWLGPDGKHVSLTWANWLTAMWQRSGGNAGVNLSALFQPGAAGLLLATPGALLLAPNGGLLLPNAPTSAPAAGSGIIWNDGGVLHVA